MTELNDLEVLAMAALDVPDLARGIEGEVEITGGLSDEQTFDEAVAETRRGQLAMVSAGWRRDKAKEKLAPYSHNIGVAVYSKRFFSGSRWGRKVCWITVTVATRFGVHAVFKLHKDAPW